MSNIGRFTLSFNTVATACPRLGNGDFDRGAHKAIVGPLAEQIMAIDGVANCEVDVSDVDVSYYTSVVPDVWALIDTVTGLVAAAAAEEGTELFPRRGDKTPTATLEQKSTGAAAVITIEFGQYILRYRPKVSEPGWDAESFLTTVAYVVGDMTAIEGVTDYDIGLASASITIDTRYCKPSDAAVHMLDVFNEVASNSDRFSGFFPFRADHGDPSFTVTIKP